MPLLNHQERKREERSGEQELPILFLIFDCLLQSFFLGKCKHHRVIPSQTGKQQIREQQELLLPPRRSLLLLLFLVT